MSLARTRRRTTAIGAALLASVALVVGELPANAQPGAGPWPQATQDAGATRQADVAGPSDPGLKWMVDLAEPTAGAPEGYRIDAGGFDHGEDNKPTLAANGMLLQRAHNPATDSDVLLGLDPDDGSVAWELPNVHRECAQAVDSQGRTWVLRTDGADLALEAIAADGSVIAGSRLDDVERCWRSGLQVGGNPELLFIYGLPTSNSFGGTAVTAYDISGATPVEAWEVNIATAGFDDLLAPRDGPRRGVVTDSSLYLPVRTGDAAEIVEIDLDDGSVVDRVELDVLEPDGFSGTLDGSDIGTVRLLLADDDTLVAGVTRRTGGDGLGYLAGFDLAAGLSAGPAWQERTGDTGTLARLDTGPARLALGDGVVVTHAGGREHLLAFDVATGALAWEGPEVFGTGAFTFRLLTDADGATYTRVPDPDVVTGRGIGKIGPNGQLDWLIPQGAIETALGITDTDEWLQAEPRWAAIDADGTLYFRERIRSRIFAIDNSGGLTEGATPPPGERVSGPDRIQTSVELSRHFDSADTVVIARHDDYADALAGAPLAVQLEAPILLTSSEGVVPPVIEELARLRPSKAVLLGGTGALSTGVEGGLRAHGVTEIVRYAGTNRWDTAAQIAGDLQGDPSRAFVVEGYNPSSLRGWPDAVAVSALAASLGEPILMTLSGELPAETATAIAAYDLDDVTIVGGTAAVSTAVQTELARLARVDRLSGDDRYATSVAVADEALAAGLGTSSVWLATGRNWPDSLSAAPVVAATAPAVATEGGVLLLVDSADLSGSAASGQWLRRNASSLDRVVAVGGTAAVSDRVLSQARTAIGG